MIVQDNLYDRYGYDDGYTKPTVDPKLVIRRKKIKKIKEKINETSKNDNTKS